MEFLYSKKYERGDIQLEQSIQFIQTDTFVYLAKGKSTPNTSKCLQPKYSTPERTTHAAAPQVDVFNPVNNEKSEKIIIASELFASTVSDDCVYNLTSCLFYFIFFCKNTIFPAKKNKR